jgi:hypothetical protein
MSLLQVNDSACCGRKFRFETPADCRVIEQAAAARERGGAVPVLPLPEKTQQS